MQRHEVKSGPARVTQETAFLERDTDVIGALERDCNAFTRGWGEAAEESRLGTQAMSQCSVTDLELDNKSRMKETPISESLSD